MPVADRRSEASGHGRDPKTGLSALERATADLVAQGHAPQTAARMAGYAQPNISARRLRERQAFTDFVISKLRDKAVLYHQILELSKQNIVYLLSSDDTPANTRAVLALGVLRLLAKAGRNGKTLIESALEEDKRETDPRVIAERLLAAPTLAPMPGAPEVIDVEVEQISG